MDESSQAEGQVDIHREANADRLVRFLERSGASRVFSNDETKKEFADSLNFDNFKSLLVRVNGIARGIPIKERDFDGQDVILEADGLFSFRFAPPDFEDKEPLLKDAFEKAKNMPDMKDKALLLSLAVNALHLFNDGNGRTSRLIYTLLHDDYSGTPEQNQRLRRILGEEGRREIDISPLVLKQHAMKLLEQDELYTYFGQPTIDEETDIEERDFNDDVISENRHKFVRMIIDSKDDFGRIALATHLASTGAIYEPFFKDVPDYSYSEYDEATGQNVVVPRTKTVMPLNDIVPKLSNTDVEDTLREYRDTRKKYVETLFDAIADPEKYQLTDESGWGDYANLKEYFLYKIYMRNKKFFGNRHPNKSSSE